jgi:integrase
LLAAVPDDDRAIWSTAILAGTRRGELRALDWPNLDLKAGVLHFKRSYDPTFGRPKSTHGIRAIPVAGRRVPVAQLARPGRESQRPLVARLERDALVHEGVRMVAIDSQTMGSPRRWRATWAPSSVLSSTVSGRMPGGAPERPTRRPVRAG